MVIEISTVIPLQSLKIALSLVAVISCSAEVAGETSVVPLHPENKIQGPKESEINPCLAEGASSVTRQQQKAKSLYMKKRTCITATSYTPQAEEVLLI